MRWDLAMATLLRAPANQKRSRVFANWRRQALAWRIQLAWVSRLVMTPSRRRRGVGPTCWSTLGRCIYPGQPKSRGLSPDVEASAEVSEGLEDLGDNGVAVDAVALGIDERFEAFMPAAVVGLHMEVNAA